MKNVFRRDNGFWFEQDNYKKNLLYLQMSDKQKELLDAFEQDGYILLKQLLSADELQTLNDALADWYIEHTQTLSSHRKEDGSFARLIGLEKHLCEVAKLFEHTQILQLQNLLFGHSKTLQTSIGFIHSSQQDLHRDIPIFNTTKKHPFFRMFIALETCHSDSGPFYGYKGSHHLSVDEKDTAYTFYPSSEAIPPINPTTWKNHQVVLEKLCRKKGCKLERFLLDAGDAVIWHPLFLHGAEKINDLSRTRRSIVLHFSLQA